MRKTAESDFSYRIIPKRVKVVGPSPDFDGKVTAAVKVDVSAASGFQIKNSSKHPKGLLPLEVFSDNAAGALPVICLGKASIVLDTSRQRKRLEENNKEM